MFSTSLPLSVALLGLLVARTAQAGDGVYSPACSNEAGGVGVRVTESHVEFTNNSGKTLAALKAYNQNRNGVVREFNTQWKPGETFRFSTNKGRGYPDLPFAWRIVVFEAKYVAPSAPKTACEDEAYKLFNRQHLALCDQINGSPSCRYDAEH